jgi:hypothetical protein
MPLHLICCVDAGDSPFVHFFSLMKRNEPKKNQDKTMLPRTSNRTPAVLSGQRSIFLGCIYLSGVFKMALCKDSESSNQKRDSYLSELVYTPITPDSIEKKEMRPGKSN